jgi:hypothetical protein
MTATVCFLTTKCKTVQHVNAPMNLINKFVKPVLMAVINDAGHLKVITFHKAAK